MKYKKIETGYVIRLATDENIIETLTQFCVTEKIYSGVFSGIGAVKNVELGFYHLDRKEYEFKTFNTTFEIVSLTGNISNVDNNPFIHIHTVLSDSEYHTYGGHLKEGIVGATCEIFFSVINSPISRVFDEVTGLKLLSLE